MEKLAPIKNNVIGRQDIKAKSRCVIKVRKDGSESDLRHLYSFLNERCYSIFRTFFWLHIHIVHIIT